MGDGLEDISETPLPSEELLDSGSVGLTDEVLQPDERSVLMPPPSETVSVDPLQPALAAQEASISFDSCF